MLFRSLICSLIVVAATNVASAAFVINLGGAERTQSGGVTLMNDAIKLIFTNEIDATNQSFVKLVIDATNLKNADGSSLADNARDKDLLFNVDPAVTSIQFQHIGVGDDVVAAKVEYSPDAFQYSSDLRFFDVRFSFAKKPNNSKALMAGDKSTYALYGNGLDAYFSFNYQATSGAADTFGAMHILSLNQNDESGKYGSTGDGPSFSTNPVPEPAAMGVWGLLLCSGGVIRCRKSSRGTAPKE